MIDALIAGRIHGKPIERVAKNGSPFAVARVRVTTTTGETVFVSIITFRESAITALLALEDGDSVALAGELTPKVWTNKEGEAKPALDLVAHVVTSEYHVMRKRKAVAEVDA